MSAVVVGDVPMEAAAFTCILVELAKLENVEIMSNISKKIYEIYEGSYDNYTLLELIPILWRSESVSECPWNKKAIINLIENEKLDVPKKFKFEPSKWEHYRIRRSLDVLVTSIFEIYEGCIIELEDGSLWDIYVTMGQRLISEDGAEGVSYEDVVYVEFCGLDEAGGEHFDMTADEFMHMLDHDNVTIVQIRDANYFMSENERDYWMNYTRLI